MGKMIDLGKKMGEDAERVAQEGHSAQEMNYPEFHVEDDQLPIDEEQVGKHIKATVKLHVKGKSHFAIKGIEVHEGENNDWDESEIEGNPNEEKAKRLNSIKKDYMKEGE